jgi:dipeptidyl aminopeptidase/acylaminoacyl peptidase
MLAERVEAGDLPELSERLPENPLVVEPTDRVGQHGGTGPLTHGRAAWLFRDRLIRQDAVRFQEVAQRLAVAPLRRVDQDRIAVYGQSYGGYMSLASMIHYSDRLVGGVERYGISDFITFLENTEAYRRDNRRAEYGDERDPAMRAVFERIAPMNNLHRIGKPMLVMQGANDPRVPQSESDQVVAGLRENGVETWYVLFADEGHGFLKKQNNDLRREVETVFLRRLFEE